MTYPVGHAIGCICRKCEDAWEEAEAGDIDVCQNCGAYFGWLPGQKYQRCGPCRAGLNDPPKEPSGDSTWQRQRGQ